MYKKFFMGIAAMAALTLVSCSSDDLNSLSDNSSKNEAISFDGYWGRSAVSVNGSRGSVIDKADDLQKVKEGFGVFGHYKETEGLEFGSNWFNNVQVTYENAKWTYSPVQYWLPQGHIDFLAYAPYAKGTTLNNSCIDFTVEGEVDKQKDLLWANAKNQTKANNSGTGKKVKFKFDHALSRLGYTVKLKNDYTGTTITLNKITLAGSLDGTKKAFYTKGTIDLSKTSSTDLWTTSTTADKQDFVWFSGTHELATTADYKNPNTEYLFVIPQDFSAQATDNLYVIVEYTYEGYKGVVYKQLNNEFEQGKAYTINLTIGLTPIEFDVDVVTGWDPANGTPIEFDSWN